MQRRMSFERESCRLNNQFLPFFPAKDDIFYWYPKQHIPVTSWDEKHHRIFFCFKNKFLSFLSFAKFTIGDRWLNPKFFISSIRYLSYSFMIFIIEKGWVSSTWFFLIRIIISFNYKPLYFQILYAIKAQMLIDIRFMYEGILHRPTICYCLINGVRQ